MINRAGLSALAAVAVVLIISDPLRAQTAPAPLNPAHGFSDGLLLPAAATFSSDACGPRKEGELEVMIGGNSFVAATFPHTVLEVGGIPRIVVDRLPSGQLGVSGTFAIAADKPAVVLDHNVFSVDSVEAPRTNRPDPAHLIVFGVGDEEALNVWYANPSTVVITGDIYFGLRHAVITPQVMNIGFRLSRSCLMFNHIDIKVG